VPSRTLKVFISSTASDLDEYRTEVLDAVMRLDQLPVDMRFFGARPSPPLAECRKLAASADAIVVIVAHRYGWVPSTAEDGDGEKSVTWHEVDAARAVGRPVFAFLVDPAYPWTLPKEQDRLVDARTWEEVQEIARAVWGLGRFKEDLGTAVVRDLFSTSDDLAAKVTAAIARWLLGSGALGNVSPAYGLSVLEIAQQHRYLNDGGDFRIAISYRVLNASEFGVSLLLPDSVSFLVPDPRALEAATTIECAIGEGTGGPASIAPEQIAFAALRTQKVDGQDRTLTRISWRPRVTPAIRPGGVLSYTCTIATKGTETAAFSAAGSFAGFATAYPVSRLAFTCHAPSGYRIDRTHFTTFLRTEDGASPEVAGLPPAVLGDDDRTITWSLEQESVRILVNYLMQLRFIPVTGGEAP
jgi:hypothetical protein